MQFAPKCADFIAERAWKYSGCKKRPLGRVVGIGAWRACQGRPHRCDHGQHWEELPLSVPEER